MENFVKWHEAATLFNTINPLLTNWKEKYFICPNCNALLFEELHLNHNFTHCPCCKARIINHQPNTLQEYLIKHQYELPRKYYQYSKIFPNVTFNQALNLYKIAVDEILCLFDATDLYTHNSLAFGRGIFLVKKNWFQKMEQAERLKLKQEEQDYGI